MKFTRVTKAQEGKSEEGKGGRVEGAKECNKEGGSEARSLKMPLIILIIMIFLNRFSDDT